MGSSIDNRLFAKLAVIIVCGVIVASGCFGQQNVQSPSDEGSAIKAFLLDYQKSGGAREDKKLRYSYSLVSLSGSAKKEVLVYLLSPDSCGSGGCNMLLLKQEASSFKLIKRFSLVNLPVWILSSKTNGWADIGITVGGGGDTRGGVAVLSFNGKSYPGNPSTVPVRLYDPIDGEILSELKYAGAYLYQ